MMDRLDRITIDPSVCLGQPTIRGGRITVSVVLKLFAEGKTIPQIVAIYPELEEVDVQQALKYAAWVVSEQIHLASTG
jgi:uncharacterized protein (DUF433 family)